MIDFQNVSKSFGEQDILLDANFRINPQERVGVVGPNGAGKSTFFKLIVGEMSPDRGNVKIPKKLRIGYLRQHLESPNDQTSLLECVSDAVTEAKEWRKRILELEEALTQTDLSGDAKERSLNELGRLQSQMESSGVYRMKDDAAAALCGLGFEAESLSRPIHEFSGGWRMRASLAKVLIANPDFLLLDEPSNYLDVPAIEWLYRFLNSYQGTLLLISHDRFLLKSLTNITLEINGSRVERYPGDVDYYWRERELRKDQMVSAKRNQDKKRIQMERFIERFRSKNTKATLVKSQEKKLAKMTEVDTPAEVRYTGTIALPPAPHSGHEAMRLENIGFSYDDEHWLFRDLSFSVERGDKIALLGYNGVGKSTLSRILAGSLTPKEGKRVTGHQVVIGYQAQDFSEIFSESNTVFETVAAKAPEGSKGQSARNILAMFGFSGEMVDKPCSVLSGGEKIRLAFATIFINPPNFLILDEPTTHLDLAARKALGETLAKYEGALCLVSHDIEFIRQLATSILAISPEKVTKYHGGYDYYHEKISSLGKDLKEDKENSGETATADNPKALRRERTRQRQVMLEGLSPLRKNVANLEGKLEALELEKDELTENLSNLPDPANFAAAGKRLKEIETETNTLTEEWELAAEKLEAMEKEYQDLMKSLKD